MTGIKILLYLMYNALYCFRLFTYSVISKTSIDPYLM